MTPFELQLIRQILIHIRFGEYRDMYPLTVSHKDAIDKALEVVNREIEKIGKENDPRRIETH